MRYINNRDAVMNLFDDIAPRFKERNGGYTRIYLLGRRPGDAAEMALVELVDKKVKEVKAKTPDIDKEKTKKEKKEKKKEKKEKKDKGEK